jgi:excisionase family DNA binding protein
MLMKTGDVAKELACSVKTIVKLIRTGKLRAVRLGKQWRIDEADLRVFISKRKT